MNKDPYTLLGVSRSATDEEIKRAYRELAKKYHPDNYANSDLADLAEEKMKEINEAYDLIQKERSGQGAGYGTSGYGSGYESGSYGNGYGNSNYGNGYGNTYGGYGAEATRFAEVRRLINSGSYAEAEVILNGMASADRGAEWNYLMGVLYLRRGWYHDAAKYFDIACTMDPQNAEYRAARARMSGGIFSGGTAYADDRRDTGSEFCNLCSSLMIADCCCECMGGDLIPCC